MRKALGAIAVVVMLVAFTGTGAIAAGLVTTSQLANNAVTTAKVKNGTLTLKDFKASERWKLVGPAGATGATGPQGPQGPAGLVGPAGPAGAAASNDVQTVQSPVVTIPAYDSGVAMATCPPGKKATGGGYFASIAIPAASAPSSTGNSWGVVINNFNNGTSIEVWAYALCL